MICRVQNALPEAFYRAPGKDVFADGFFAGGSTRQRLCRVQSSLCRVFSAPGKMS
jgi:hypothetical protein